MTQVHHNRARRAPAAAAALLTLALLLPACGEDSSDAPSTTAAASTSTTSAGGPATSTTMPTEGSTSGAYPSAITDEVVDNPAFDSVERRLVDRVSRAGLPGASLLVVQDGEMVEQEAWLEYGIDTVVPIASGSKWLSAVTIMTVVDEGLLELDEPIATYVPELERRPVGQVTLRQLLSFTSGLTADERVPCTSSGEGTLQECARDILAEGLVHPPGDAFRYGGQHLHVAGALAEIVTGESFTDLFQQRVADPLGMDSTMFGQVRSPSTTDVTHPGPAGTARSNLGDYGRFLEMLVHDGVAPDGTRIISEDSLVEMRTNHTEDVRYLTAASFRVASEGPYALGNWIDWTDEDGDALVRSSDGAFGFRPWIDDLNGLFGVYLIEDHGTGYVEGDPDAPGADAEKIHTSGLWVFEWVAEALGGSLPEVQYPHRRP